MNIILCGLPGSGKTTVGKILAEQLGRHFFDTDRLLESHYAAKTEQSMGCREIAKILTEESFRHLETEILKEMTDTTHSVIATGGGTLTYLPSAELLKIMGCLVYLKASPELILERILKNGMPAYLDPVNPLYSFQKLARKRQSLYKKFCHIAIDVDGKTPQEIASLAIKNANDFGNFY